MINGNTNALTTFYNDYSDYEGCYPSGIAVNAVTNKVYIPDLGGDSTLQIYNGSTYAWIKELSYSSGEYEGGVAVNSVTNRIYFPDAEDPGTLYVVDGETDTGITDITLGVNPVGVAVNTITNIIYVTNKGDIPCQSSMGKAIPLALQ